MDFKNTGYRYREKQVIYIGNTGYLCRKYRLSISKIQVIDFKEIPAKVHFQRFGQGELKDSKNMGIVLEIFLDIHWIKNKTEAQIFYIVP